MFAFLLAVSIGVSCFMLEKKLNEYRTAEDVHINRTMEVRQGRKVDFDKLKAENGDVVGWIYLPDSRIDYPVVQGEDNDYYLHRDIDGSYIYDGSIFVDSTVDEPFRDFNTVIYGHRMMSGAMFAGLKYFDDYDYMKEHGIFQIETPDASYDLHVVAFCKENADSKLYTTWFQSDSIPAESGWLDEYDENANETDIAESDLPLVEEEMTKSDFVDLIKKDAVTLSGISFDENDTFVTLSTCAFAKGDERNQVIGILKDAAKEERAVTEMTKKPLINKWLIAQAGAALLAVVMIAMLLVPLFRRQK